MELEIKQRNGQATGRKVTLNSEIFAATPNDALLPHQMTMQYGLM